MMNIAENNRKICVRIKEEDSKKNSNMGVNIEEECRRKELQNMCQY